MNRFLTNPMDFINLFITDKRVDATIDIETEYAITKALEYYSDYELNEDFCYKFKISDDEYLILDHNYKIKEPKIDIHPFSNGVIYHAVIPKLFTAKNKLAIMHRGTRMFIFDMISRLAPKLNNFNYKLALLTIAAIGDHYRVTAEKDYGPKYAEMFVNDYKFDFLPYIFKMYEKYDVYYNIHNFILQCNNDLNNMTSIIWKYLNIGNTKREYPILIYSLHGNHNLITKFENVLGQAMTYIDIMNPGKSTMTNHLISMMNDAEYEEECVFILSNNNPDDKYRIIENNNLSDAEIHLAEIEENKVRITINSHQGNPIIMDIDFDDEMAPYHIMSINPAVKDSFNAKHKNGIPTSIEEYKASPMGNPVPIVVDEPMTNKFIVPPIYI